MASVFLTDVDDYLAPSQACINPLFTESGGEGKKGDEEDNKEQPSSSNQESKVVPRRRRRRRVNEGGRASNEGDCGGIPLTKSTTEKATVSIADCLACSGCVTSAETVLVSQHSLPTLREACQQQQSNLGRKKKIVFTLSPASLADFIRYLYFYPDDHDGDDNATATVHTPLRPEVVARKLTTLLHHEFGALWVMHGAVPLQLSLWEAAEEFCHRYKIKKNSCPQQQQQQQPPTTGLRDDDDNGKGWKAQGQEPQQQLMPSMALSSTRTQWVFPREDPSSHHQATEPTSTIVTTHKPGRDAAHDNNRLPLLASSCPAVVCLVEKSFPHAVPHLASAKSPMAVAGALLARRCQEKKSANNNNNDGHYYHVAIMPCHDKKLEATRKGLAQEDSDGKQQPDVDLVITTGELWTLLDEAASSCNNHSSHQQPWSNRSNSTNDDVEMMLQDNGEGNDVNDTPTAAAAVERARAYLEALPEAKVGDLSSTVLGLDALSIEDQDEPVWITMEMDDMDVTTAAVTTIAMDVDDMDCSDHQQQSRHTLVSTSGGYADFIFRYAARQLFGYTEKDEELPWQPVTTNQRRARISARVAAASKQHRADLWQICLYRHADGSYSTDKKKKSDKSLVEEPEPVLRFATAYGFSNVQRILQPLKDSEDTAKYDYVEVMACPSGCLNGGGQIHQRSINGRGRRETPTETRGRVQRNRVILETLQLPGNHMSASSSKVYAILFSSGPFGGEAQRWLHTRYHVVPKLELMTGVTAGVALHDTQW